jgi:hypothetical protein
VKAGLLDDEPRREQPFNTEVATALRLVRERFGGSKDRRNLQFGSAMRPVCRESWTKSEAGCDGRYVSGLDSRLVLGMNDGEKRGANKRSEDQEENLWTLGPFIHYILFWSEPHA